MIPAEVGYRRVDSLEEAFAELQAPGARPLAGGQALISLMKRREIAPTLLVDIAPLGLRGVTRDGGTLCIGALTTWNEVSQAPEVVALLPSLAQAAAVQGDRQVRNRATVGGALGHGDPASDVWANALALDGRLVVASPAGERRIEAGSLLTAPGKTVLETQDVIVALEIPIVEAQIGAAYRSVRHPSSHYPLAGVAARATTAPGGIACRVAVTGLATMPFRALAVEDAVAAGAHGVGLDDAIAAAVDTAQLAPDSMLDDDYRRHVAGRCIARAVDDATNR